MCKDSVDVCLVECDAWIKERDRPVRGQLRGNLRGCDLSSVITREQGHHDRYACLYSPYQELKLELRLRFQFRQHAQCQTSGA